MATRNSSVLRRSLGFAGNLEFFAIVFLLRHATATNDSDNCVYLSKTRPDVEGYQVGNIGIKLNYTLPPLNVTLCLIKEGYPCLAYTGYKNTTDSKERINFNAYFNKEYLTQIRATYPDLDLSRSFYNSSDLRPPGHFLDSKQYKKLSKKEKLQRLKMELAHWNCVSGNCTNISETVGKCAPGESKYRVWDLYVYQTAFNRFSSAPSNNIPDLYFICLALISVWLLDSISLTIHILLNS